MDGTPPAQPSENPSLVQADPDPGRLAVIQIHSKCHTAFSSSELICKGNLRYKVAVQIR